MCAIDTDSAARQIIARIRAAALQRFADSKETRAESDQSRRVRVVELLKTIDRELVAFGASRSEVEQKVGMAFSVPHEFGKILEEACLQPLGGVG